jgi:2-polyprenyl-6-methoxyphenol hydroxylase-like FAD-dependent oxidoreductase
MLKACVGAAAPDCAFALAIRAMPLVDPWPSARIALVGDAIHASPVNGTGANSALEDPALLCRFLIADHSDLQRAVDEYAVELSARVRAMRSGMVEMRSRLMSSIDARGFSHMPAEL